MADAESAAAALAADGAGQEERQPQQREEDRDEEVAAPPPRGTLPPTVAAAAASAASAVEDAPDHASAETSPLLLRTWRNPPVAPAVVVGAVTPPPNDAGGRPDGEGDGDVADEAAPASGGGGRYTYPVATFVRDLVRTSIDSMHNSNSQNNNLSHQNGFHQHQHDEYPLSVRSEPPTGSAVGGDDGMGGHFALHHHYPHPQEATSLRADLDALRGDMEDDADAEFILVDGDLIVVPPQPPNDAERRAIEDNLRDVDYAASAAARSCRRRQSGGGGGGIGRLRRGVRKFNKLFKRSRIRTPTSADLQSQQQQRDRISSFDDHRPAAATVAAAAAVPTTGQHAVETEPKATAPAGGVPSDDNDTSSSSPSRQQSRKNKRRKDAKTRRSWRRTDSSEQVADAAGSEGAKAAAPKTASLKAVPGIASTLAIRRQRSRTPPPPRRRQQDLHSDPPDERYLQQHPPPPPRPVPLSGAGGAAAAAPPDNGGLVSESDSLNANRAQSVTASFVGTADQLLEAGVLPSAIAAEAYVEFEDAAYYKKLDDSEIVPSLVPRDADLKVDKAEAPDVESMLRRAVLETEESEISGATMPTGDEKPVSSYGLKRDGTPVPLSMASRMDKNVYNDTLKVVMVGCLWEKSWLARALRGSNKTKNRKRTTLAVDVHTWTPPTPTVSNSNASHHDDEFLETKFSIWDTQGSTSALDGSPNFGGHPATQSLFFSSQSLYVLVWDLAGNNPNTFHRSVSAGEVDSDEDDEEDFEDEFLREETNRQADRLLQADVQSRVLSWVDCIARRGPKSAVLPVAVIPQGMSDSEVQRRCSMMQSLLQMHVGRRFAGNPMAPKLLTGAENVLCVSYTEGYGVEQLRDTIVDIATDPSRSVFQHVGTPIPEGTGLVMDIIRRLKQDHKLILIDYLVGEIGPALNMEQVMEALHFLSSTGEVLYFGTDEEDVLSRFVILSRKWLVSALSCILRNDLKRELEETRRFMNMQCLYSDDRFVENEMTVALAGSTTSNCPLLSDSDAKMLWQSMSFMREAADRYSQLSDSTTTTPTMFYFLERLLVHSEILMPLGASESSLDRSEVFFVPSLLPEVDPRDIWTFRSSESWMTTICHSWLFRDGAPSDVMELVSVGVLRDLYEFSRSFLSAKEPRPQAIARTRTVPIGRSTLHEFYEEHDKEAIGRVRIHQIMCWRSSVLVKIGTVFADQESDELRESFVEILITLVDQSSHHCVASDAMRPGKRCLFH